MAIIRVEVFKERTAADLQKAKLELKGFLVAGPEAADEVGWATLLFHRDYRDYFLARGLGAHLRVRAGSVLSAWVDATRYDATSIMARDPWTPFRGSEPWRPNPTIDEGRFTELRTGLEIGTTRHGDRRGGVRLRLEWLHGQGDSVVPVLLPLTVRPGTGPHSGAVHGPAPGAATLGERLIE